MLLVFVSLMRFLGPSGFTTENQFIETDKQGSITILNTAIKTACAILYCIIVRF